MSEENKDLGDKAKDAMDDAKEAASNAADKASEKASELKEDAKEAFEDAKEKASEFADDAKEAASDFAEDAKETAKEFTDDVKETFATDNPDSGKNIAIIAHITLIGWVIALIMNNGNKTEFGSFYLRQTLGIFLFGLVLGFIPLVGCFAGLICLVFIIISLISAINGKMKPIAGVGALFQDLFKFIQ